MSTIRQRLVRRPITRDPQLTRLHQDIAGLLNGILDGGSDAAFEGGVGPILKDANGHYWRVGVTTAGALTTVDLGTDRP